MKVYHKSVRPNDKPEWLLNVQLAVDGLAGVMTLQGDDCDFRNLKAFIDAEIEVQRSRGNIRAGRVETELRTDDGRTVIMVFRDGSLLQTYYIG
ncbi:hypothetical protein [Bacteroides heparinolyticus]|uniref:hypothetical protein n=1 Tax=Prevotella heparinolytica TaxID=28113 RepID=UPI0023EF8DC7|nr:hypothetical protein [Bacteroides heparinolyticus]